MKKIIVTLILSTMFISPTFAESKKVKVPENINYYEYCYMTEQCSVPKKLRSIIKANIMSIKLKRGPIY